MPDPVHRVAVQHGPHAVDLGLPSDVPIGVLLPSIIEIVSGGAVLADQGRHWQLSRVGHGPLDEANSLYDNAVGDGELLLLTTTEMPAPVLIPDDPWHAVAGAADTDCARPRAAATALSLVAVVCAATTLAWSGIVTHAVRHAVTAGMIAAATAIGAVAAQRVRESGVPVTLSATAVTFAGTAGFLAVPGGPSAANSLLAAAVACTTSVLLLRIIRRGAIYLTALASLAALASVASACAVAWALSVATTGAVLTTLGLGALAVAARLSITVAALAPAMSCSDDRVEMSSAVKAHEILTGLVFGSAAATALGSALAASELRGAILAVVAGVVMVLRSRTHVDVRRRTGLVVGGAAAIATSFLCVVVSAPGQANWMCLLGAAVAMYVLVGGTGGAGNPSVRRAVEVLEYVALAAVIPLACWVGGLYALVRGLSLP